MLRCDPLGTVAIHEPSSQRTVADAGDGGSVMGASSGMATAGEEAEVALCLWITSVLCGVLPPGARATHRALAGGRHARGGDLLCDWGRALDREYAAPRSAAAAGGHHPLPEAPVVLEDVQAGEPRLPRVTTYLLSARPRRLRESDGQVPRVCGARAPDQRVPDLVRDRRDASAHRADGGSIGPAFSDPKSSIEEFNGRHAWPAEFVTPWMPLRPSAWTRRVPTWPDP